MATKANDIITFDFKMNTVRVVMVDERPWFIASDLAALLGYRNAPDMLRMVRERQKGTHKVRTLGGDQEVNIVSEGGMWRCVLRSKRKEADDIQLWLEEEVLPALYRTGRYAMAGVADDDEDDDDIGMAVPHMGSIADRDKIKTAVSVVRMYERNWGAMAARAMAVKLGFPMLDVDLPPAVAPAALRAMDAGVAPPSGEQMEGDVIRWGEQVKLTGSRRDATHRSELYDSYSRWCSVYRFRPMHPDRFERMMHTLFGTEEHPEMFRCVIKRP